MVVVDPQVVAESINITIGDPTRFPDSKWGENESAVLLITIENDSDFFLKNLEIELKGTNCKPDDFYQWWGIYVHKFATPLIKTKDPNNPDAGKKFFFTRFKSNVGATNLDITANIIQFEVMPTAEKDAAATRHFNLPWPP